MPTILRIVIKGLRTQPPPQGAKSWRRFLRDECCAYKKRIKQAGCRFHKNIQGGRKDPNVGTAGDESIRRPDPASTPSTHGSQSNVSKGIVDHKHQTIG